MTIEFQHRQSCRNCDGVKGHAWLSYKEGQSVYCSMCMSLLFVSLKKRKPILRSSPLPHGKENHQPNVNTPSSSSSSPPECRCARSPCWPSLGLTRTQWAVEGGKHVDQTEATGRTHLQLETVNMLEAECYRYQNGEEKRDRVTEFDKRSECGSHRRHALPFLSVPSLAGDR